MTNSKRNLQLTLTSSVENVTGASMGSDRVTDDCTMQGVSSCRRGQPRGKNKDKARSYTGLPLASCCSSLSCDFALDFGDELL